MRIDASTPTRFEQRHLLVSSKTRCGLRGSSKSRYHPFAMKLQEGDHRGWRPSRKWNFRKRPVPDLSCVLRCLGVNPKPWRSSARSQRATQRILSREAQSIPRGEDFWQPVGLGVCSFQFCRARISCVFAGDTYSACIRARSNRQRKPQSSTPATQNPVFRPLAIASDIRAIPLPTTAGQGPLP